MPGHKDWMEKARGDFLLASKAVGDDRVFASAVYLAHQSGEKSLKAFLFFLSKPIPKTHDLGILLNLCINIKKDFILITKECSILAPYEFDSRYPNDSFKVNQQHLLDALKAANYIFDFVENKTF